VSSGNRVNLTLLAGILGVFLPSKMGIEYLDPLVLLPVSCVSLMLVAALTPEWGFPRVALAGMAYGSGVVAAGIAVVNAGFWHGVPIIPPATVLVSIPLLSFSVSAFAAAAGSWMNARNLTPAEARTRIRGVLLVLLALWVFRSSVIPETLRGWVAPFATTGGIAAIVLVLSTALLLAARRNRPEKTPMLH
jgi:hypothetical protein